MSTISKQLSGLVFSGAALTLASASWKNNVRVIYGFNAGGNGYTSFKPGSNFNSLTQLQPDGVYILDAATAGFDIPGAVLATTGSPAALTVSKTLLGFMYSDTAALSLASASWKSNVRTLYGFNAGGNGYTSFKPGSNFNSLTQLVKDAVYILDAVTTGFAIPGGAVSSNGTVPVTTTPSAPNWSFNTTTRNLTLSHATLGISELEFSYLGGPYAAYSVPIIVSSAAHAAGDWLGRTKAVSGRNASQPVASDSIDFQHLLANAQYSWVADTATTPTITSLANTGTAPGYDLVTVGSPLPIVALPELGGKRVVQFHDNNNYLQTANNFPVVKQNGPRTQYIAFYLDEITARAIAGVGGQYYYGSDFSIAFDGANNQAGEYLLHLAMGAVDVYAPGLLIGEMNVVGLRSTPNANGCIISTIINGREMVSQQQGALDTNASPLWIGTGGWNSANSSGLKVAANQFNLLADTDTDFSNGVRAMQLYYGQPARAAVSARSTTASSFNAAARTLEVVSTLGAAEGNVEYSHYDGPWTTYTGPIALSKWAQPEGEFVFRAIEASATKTDMPTLSPAVPTALTNDGLVRLDITADDFSVVNKTTKTVVSLAFSNAYGSTYAANQLYTGKATIKTRGNYTSTLPKKPFSLVLVKDDGTTDNKFPLLGMYTDTDFVLLAEYADPALVRSSILHYSAKTLGLVAVETRPVEVYVNGDYQGYYTLTEKVKQAKVGVEKLGTLAADQMQPQASGGYLLQNTADYQEDYSAQTYFKSTLYNSNPTSGYNGNFYGSGHSTVVEYPKFGSITDTQLQYITDYVNAAETSLDGDWNDLVNGPQAYYEPLPLAYAFIAEEFGKNQDGENQSTYYHKHRNGRLVAGCLWDGDIMYPCYTVSYAVSPLPTEDWITGTPRFKRLTTMPGFRALLGSTLAGAGGTALADTVNFAQQRMDLLASTGAADRDNAKWNTRGQNTATLVATGQQEADYNLHRNAILAWLKKRRNWLIARYPV